MSDQAPVDEDEYGYCNACGEEMWDGDECCDGGEWVAHPLKWEPSDADARAFANAYGYSVDESRSYLRRNGPDQRTSSSAHPEVEA